MASFNKVVLVGNLVRDPELRHTQGNDLPVARSAIAVSRKYKDKEEVMFIDIVVFGRLAEILSSYTTKGSPILIEGRLNQSTWEQEGQKRSKHEIVVESLQLLGSKRDKAESGSGMYDAGSPSTRSSGSFSDDEDIPF